MQSTCTKNYREAAAPAATTPHFQTKKPPRSVDGSEKSDNFFFLFMEVPPVSFSKLVEGKKKKKHFKRFYIAPLPLTHHPYTEACRRRDNISFRVLLKTYQQFLSLTPNQAEGTRSTSYGLLFSPRACPCCLAPPRGHKLGAEKKKVLRYSCSCLLYFSTFCFPSG